jgi:hypothetical protein
VGVAVSEKAVFNLEVLYLHDCIAKGSMGSHLYIYKRVDAMDNYSMLWRGRSLLAGKRMRGFCWMGNGVWKRT